MYNQTEYQGELERVKKELADCKKRNASLSRNTAGQFLTMLGIDKLKSTMEGAHLSLTDESLTKELIDYKDLSEQITTKLKEML